jgi:heparosan-N-sulfate-glucuronate 5-epimerase
LTGAAAEAGRPPRGLTERVLPYRLHPKRLLSLTFDQPLGPRVAEGGYHLDLRAKCRLAAVWPPPELGPLEKRLWVVICQWGLGALELFLTTHDERWLTAARGAGEHVLEGMVRGGELDGALRHGFAYPHTFLLAEGWISGMAQGEAASLLVRLHRVTGDERYAEAATRALAPIAVPRERGGCGIPWRGGWWAEEYPTEPPSLVLNGKVFALLGMIDVAEQLGDDGARRSFDEGVDLVAANVAAWDLGWWSLYDLYPHPRPNVASFAYQELHENLLRALDRCAPRPELSDHADRFGRQYRSPAARARAFAAKVAFRRSVPRVAY